MTSSATPPPFVRHAPGEPALPVVFDSPHSGFYFPPDFEPAATRGEIRTTWDAYVDELCAGVTAAGATLLAATFPRAYIDANRAADDIDPEILATPWPEPVALSEHSARGMGLIRRFALPGVPMYRRKLSVAEVRGRLDRWYQPYRAALAAELDAAWARHGAVWHFDMHSMKARGNAMNRDRGALRPDFVIGDRGGTTAPPELTAWVAAFFTRLGYTVTVNKPYQGADLVRAHGDPARRRFSVQIEINRGLYLDEATGERSAGFARVRDELSAFARAVAGRVRDELGGGRAA